MKEEIESIDKYTFIQLLYILRDKMINKEDAEIIQDFVTDFIELDKEKIKEQYCTI